MFRAETQRRRDAVRAAWLVKTSSARSAYRTAAPEEGHRSWRRTRPLCASASLRLCANDLTASLQAPDAVRSKEFSREGAKVEKSGSESGGAEYCRRCGPAQSENRCAGERARFAPSREPKSRSRSAEGPHRRLHRHSPSASLRLCANPRCRRPARGRPSTLRRLRRSCSGWRVRGGRRRPDSRAGRSWNSRGPGRCGSNRS
jgi:hypothetical protein